MAFVSLGTPVLGYQKQKLNNSRYKNALAPKSPINTLDKHYWTTLKYFLRYNRNPVKHRRYNFLRSGFQLFTIFGANFILHARLGPENTPFLFTTGYKQHFSKGNTKRNVIIPVKYKLLQTLKIKLRGKTQKTVMGLSSRICKT